MPYFPRFVKRWASAGTIAEPTDGQTDTGFAHLGPNPPTVEEFNALFQWLDDKDGWLYRQIRSVMTSAGVTAAATPDTLLSTALTNQYGSGGTMGLNGWQRLPGGLIIQWGRGTTVTGGGDSVFFPISFPTTAYVAVAGEGNATGWTTAGVVPRAFGVSSLVNNGFGLYCAQLPGGSAANALATGTAYQYIALGT